MNADRVSDLYDMDDVCDWGIIMAGLANWWLILLSVAG